MKKITFASQLAAFVLLCMPGLKCFAQTCTPPPANLVSWWRAEGDATDAISGNNGAANCGFSQGEVGEAFSMDGATTYVVLGNPTNLQLQNFTIEAWIQRSSSTAVSLVTQNAEIVSWGTGGYAFGLWYDGRLYLDSVDISEVAVSAGLTDTSNFHHVAVTKSGTVVVFYLDGAALATNVFTNSFTFNTSLAIGARGDNLNNNFFGAIDELSIYSRALSLAEIQTIYHAGSAGKCISGAPIITSQPTNITLYVGSGAVFTVGASGSLPLSCQWSVNGTNLPGATNFTLMLTNLQTSQSGNYTATISNSFGLATSSASLMVIPPPPCTPAPAGIVGWWPAENNATDVQGVNNGTLHGSVGYGTGEIGQGFVFNGNGEGVLVGGASDLQNQNFTIEGWVKRASLSTASFGSGGVGVLFGWGTGGYSLYMGANGGLGFSMMGNSAYVSGPSVSDTNFHHIAVTYSSGSVIFYLDGVAAQTQTYNVTFAFSGQAAIGIRADNYDNSFLGTIDELTVYNRALAQSEVQNIVNASITGKCEPPPYITAQPGSETVLPGANVILQVGAVGALINYQWYFNGTGIPGATNSILTLTNVSASQTGSYLVTISNVFGTVASSSATVALAPNCISTPSGLVDLWSGEGNANDYVGQNNGTLEGGIGFAAGKTGQAFVMDGTDANVFIAASTNLNVGVLGSGLTMECWIKPNNLTGSQAILEWNNGTNIGVQFYINTTASNGSSSGVLYANFTDTAGVYHNFNSAAGILNSTAFQHVAATYDPKSSNAVLYLNGLPVTNKILGAFIPQTSYNLSIGNELSGGGANYFNGLLDEVTLYKRALSAAEIQEIYAVGSGRTNCLAPFFVTQPQTQYATPGSNVTFSAAPFGAAQLQCQWSQNGTNIPGATNVLITISNIQPAGSGVYALTVTNEYGTTTSSNAALNLILVSAYANNFKLTNSQNAFAGPVTLQLSNYFSGGYIFYTLDGSTPTPFSPVYSGQIILSNSAVLQTLAFSVDFTVYAYSSPITLSIQPSYALTTSTAGGGTISRSPTNSSFVSNTIVSLTATPSNGWTFLQWQGDLNGTVATNSVTMTRNKTVQAVFGTTVTNSVGGNGSVVFDPPGYVFPYGYTLQASAIPQPGNVFVLWGNAASGSTNPLAYLVTNANTEISALFTTLGSGQVALTVVPVGHGQVSVNPRANGYSTGSSVTITATPNAGKAFLGWSGSATGNQNPLTVTMNQSKVIYANFTTNYSLSIATLPGGFSQGVQLSLIGEIGTHYRLDSSTDLLHWTPLFNLTNAVGTLYYMDTTTSNLNKKFYQSVILH